MVKMVADFIVKKALKGRQKLERNMTVLRRILRESLIVLREALGFVFGKALEWRKGLNVLHGYIMQRLSNFLALFEKQELVIKGVAKASAIKYVRFKARFRSLAKKKVEALIRNKFFIFFARLVQKIFWTCVGIGIYAAILIKTQPDGYERVTDVLKRLFPWMW